jgi:hypothetical protein
MLIFNDQDAYIEKKMVNDIDDFSWIPSESLKYRLLSDNFGLVVCNNAQDISALKNFGNLERVTNKSKTVVLFKLK